MNDLTRIEWTAVAKGIILDGILYNPISADEDYFKCTMCDYRYDNGNRCKVEAPCLAFGHRRYLKHVGKLDGVFVEHHKDLTR